MPSRCPFSWSNAVFHPCACHSLRYAEKELLNRPLCIRNGRICQLAGGLLQICTEFNALYKSAGSLQRRPWPSTTSYDLIRTDPDCNHSCHEPSLGTSWLESPPHLSECTPYESDTDLLLMIHRFKMDSNELHGKLACSCWSDSIVFAVSGPDHATTEEISRLG
jgi:hypothetical protein